MKSGDKIVCVKNIRGAWQMTPRLFVGKSYTVHSDYLVFPNKKFIILKEHSINDSYSEDCFILLKDYRKLKLEKICSSQVIE